MPRAVDFDRHDGCAAWSPDGRGLAFVRDGRLSLTDHLGSRVRGLRAIRTVDDVLGWLDHPRRVVYTVGNELYAVIGSRPTPRLLARFGKGETASLLSPTGRHVVVSNDERAAVFDLQRRRRTTIPGVIDPYSMKWSPDGRRLAYVSAVSGDLTYTPVAVFDVPSKRVWRLKESAFAAPPAISPDGSLVAYASMAGQADFTLPSQIRVVDLRTGNVRQLTSGDGGEHTQPIFSPDGTRIVYQHGGDLREVRPDGRDDRRLTNAGGYGDECPAFAPDGKQIAFLRTQKYVSAIVLMDADGKNQHGVPDNG